LGGKWEKGDSGIIVGKRRGTKNLEKHKPKRSLGSVEGKKKRSKIGETEQKKRLKRKVVSHYARKTERRKAEGRTITRGKF